MKNNLILIFFIISSFLTAEKTTFENITITSNEVDFAKKLAFSLSEEIFEFHKKIGKYPEIKVNILIAEDKKEFQSWTHQNAEIIENSQAFYNGKTNTIYIRNLKEIKNSDKLKRTLLHEYIHSFNKYYWKTLPLWFNEGMAVYFSGELNLNRELNFARDYIMGNSRTLNQMKYYYPKNQIEWDSFYSKSGLAIKYLYMHRRNGFYELWDYAAIGKTFESAFLLSFRYTSKDFSAFFEEYSRTHFRAGLFFASTSLIWGLIPFFFIIVVLIKKMKNKRIIENWEAEDSIPLEKND